MAKVKVSNKAVKKVSKLLRYHEFFIRRVLDGTESRSLKEREEILAQGLKKERSWILCLQIFDHAPPDSQVKKEAFNKALALARAKGLRTLEDLAEDTEGKAEHWQVKREIDAYLLARLKRARNAPACLKINREACSVEVETRALQKALALARKPENFVEALKLARPDHEIYLECFRRCVEFFQRTERAKLKKKRRKS